MVRRGLTGTELRQTSGGQNIFNLMMIVSYMHHVSDCVNRLEDDSCFGNFKPAPNVPFQPFAQDRLHLDSFSTKTDPPLSTSKFAVPP